jgi:hypothetical protein
MPISRRAFLARGVVAGTGLVIGVRLSPSLLADLQRRFRIHLTLGYT